MQQIVPIKIHTYNPKQILQSKAQPICQSGTIRGIFAGKQVCERYQPFVAFNLSKLKENATTRVSVGLDRTEGMVLHDLRRHIPFRTTLPHHHIIIA